MAYQTPSSDLGIYGDGSDGDVTITAGTTVTATRIMLYNSLTVPATATFITAGWPILVKTFALIDGTFHNKGSDAVGSTGGAGAAAGIYSAGENGLDGLIGDGGV